MVNMMISAGSPNGSLVDNWDPIVGQCNLGIDSPNALAENGFPFLLILYHLVKYNLAY